MSDWQGESMVTPGADKRMARRFALQLPVAVKDRDSERMASTRDISSRGICFYTETRLETGAELEFTLTLPPEITMTEAIQVHCKGKVVRVEAMPDGKMVIAAQINQYQFMPTN
jgi:pyridoxine/pyridoxamine 5'-phosphate oxidase